VHERTQQLAESNERLQQAFNDLRRMEASRLQMMANLSHDLRAPLTLIQGYSEALLEDMVTGEKRDRFLRQIQAKAQQMERLIHDLYYLSQLESRELPFDKTPIRLHALLERVGAQFESDARHAGIRLEVHLPDETKNIEVNIDLSRMKQVFSNLIYNAIRHTTSGGKSTSRAPRPNPGKSSSPSATPVPAFRKNIFRSFFNAFIKSPAQIVKAADWAGHLQGNRRNARRADLGRKPARTRQHLLSDLAYCKKIMEQKNV